MSESEYNPALLARVPEHSPELMAAMSGGKPFLVDRYFFLAGNDWLMAIGYPLRGKFNSGEFAAAIDRAAGEMGATSIFAIAPAFPEHLAAKIVDSDRYHILSVNAPVPARLRNPVKHAAAALTVSEGHVFTPAHRALWAEFLERQAGHMADRVAALYTSLPDALKSAPQLALLDARDASGNLAACLVLDYAPKHFVSYIIGAHSRKNYVPHASDLLFAAMLEKARQKGKRFVHLGLGVNDSILRFKKKWGAKPYFPYNLAQWDVARNCLAQAPEEPVSKTIALAILRSGGSARQVLGDAPSRKPFAMLWQVEKNGRISWLGGTAHFFCHSFEPSFRKLFRNVDNVIFEGPLDAAFMNQVDAAGKTPAPGAPPLIDLLTEEEILKLEKIVLGPRGGWAKALGLASNSRTDVRWLLRNARPWCAFFTLWTTFLERQGWKDSVDMEAWRTAQDMGKNIIGMEDLEEQLESLGSLPVERVLRFFRNCGQWRKMSTRNMHAYLAGDLEGMMGSSAEFPTRTEHVVGRRDQRFRERMRPYLEKGRCAVFVGTAHLVNLRHMLGEDGFTVRQKPFGIWPRIHLRLRDIFRKDGRIEW